MSLVEVMVSVVIGLVVTGAVVVMYLSTSGAGKLQSAYSEMNENAQLALGILSRELLLAGYSAPQAAAGTVVQGVGAAAVTVINRNYAARAVFGCDTGFVDNAINADATCIVGGGNNPSLEVNYEADVTNTIPNGANIPTDCLGNGLPLAGAFYLARNRYYVAISALNRPELHCASNTANPGAPIVENVESIAFLYGEAIPAAPRIIARYVTAANVTNWPLVVSVRVCVELRGSEAVLTSEDTLSYLNCNGVATAIVDRIPRRAYFSTVTLRNRMAF